MIGPLVAGLSGLLAGSAHVVAGPDHIAALLPLAAGQRRRAAKVGALWGLGHGLGVLTLSLVGRWLRHRIHVEAWSAAAELVVGLLLIFLGAWTLFRSRWVVVHDHPHDDAADPQHAHVHLHVADATIGSPEHPRSDSHRIHSHSAFGFGVLHGAAGAGHLLGVLPSLALSDGAAVAYVGAYVIAAIVAMALFAALVGRLTQNRTRLPAVLRWAGGASLVVGLYWTGNTLLA